MSPLTRLIASAQEESRKQNTLTPALSQREREIAALTPALAQKVKEREKALSQPAQPEGKATRLPGTPQNLRFGNQNLASVEIARTDLPLQAATETLTAETVTAEVEEASSVETIAASSGAGYHAGENPGNHSQVVVPEGVDDEISGLLAKLGVNLSGPVLGRKYVFDDFLRGRLVSLLAMGLSLRQSAAALGLSHVALHKELKRTPELAEQVNAARFQAQIQPLLVILRESKRSWRAATWLVNYLGKQANTYEETPDEAFTRKLDQEEERMRRNRERFQEQTKARAEEEARKREEELKRQRAEIRARFDERGNFIPPPR